MHRNYRLRHNVYLYIPITFSRPMQPNTSLFFDKTLLLPEYIEIANTLS
jgi:hypothetical protein